MHFTIDVRSYPVSKIVGPEIRPATNDLQGFVLQDEESNQSSLSSE